MTRTLKYQFDFEGGPHWVYELQFDEHHRFIPKEGVKPKNWTHLDFHKCPHCPLKRETTPYCPVARNLDHIVEDSKATLSYTRALVTVYSDERTYQKQCSSQDGLRSLFGAIMASSGCPHLDWLRPLARFHLPFSDTDETLFRVLSLQLMDQFLNNGEAPTKEAAATIQERYLEVEKVNHAFINRIRSYCSADADKNAITSLDGFVQLFPLHLDDDFKHLRIYFEA